MQKEIWHRFNAMFVSLVKHLLPLSGSLHRHDTMQIYQLQRQSTSYRDGLTSNHDGFTIDHDGLTSNHHGESLPVTIMVDLTRHDVYTSYQDGLTNYYISCRNQTEAKLMWNDMNNRITVDWFKQTALQLPQGLE